MRIEWWVAGELRVADKGPEPVDMGYASVRRAYEGHLSGEELGSMGIWRVGGAWPGGAQFIAFEDAYPAAVWVARTPGTRFTHQVEARRHTPGTVVSPRPFWVTSGHQIAKRECPLYPSIADMLSRRHHVR